MIQVDEEDLIYKKDIDGETLVNDILKTRKSGKHIGSIVGDGGKSYWEDTIDKTKNYFVIKWEHHRLFHPCSYTYYRISEITNK